MAETLPKSVQRLIRVFARLPGVGSRTAMRFVLHLVREGEPRLRELAEALTDAANAVRLCERCRGLAEAGALCEVCADPRRSRDTICVVEGIGDQIAIESTGQYEGRYFVLHRLLSPLKGIGPDELGVARLLELVQKEGVREVVLATPLTTDGETTATYIGRVLSPEGVSVSRLASGVPVGGTIEYLDRLTLARAFQDRKAY